MLNKYIVLFNASIIFICLHCSSEKTIDSVHLQKFESMRTQLNHLLEQDKALTQEQLKLQEEKDQAARLIKREQLTQSQNQLSQQIIALTQNIIDTLNEISTEEHKNYLITAQNTLHRYQDKEKEIQFIKQWIPFVQSSVTHAESERNRGLKRKSPDNE